MVNCSGQIYLSDFETNCLFHIVEGNSGSSVKAQGNQIFLSSPYFWKALFTVYPLTPPVVRPAIKCF